MSQESIIFSVIMPAYNASRYLREATKSVLDQTFTALELIIINDGSVDDTPLIAEDIAQKDLRVRVVHQKNKGLGATRNVGMRLAKGEWIAFLDADDYWLPTKLMLQWEFIQSHPDIEVVCTNGYALFEGKSLSEAYPFDCLKGKQAGKQLYQNLLNSNLIPVLSVVFQKKIFQVYGGMNEETVGAEDWDYWLKLAKSGVTFFGMDTYTFVYRVHSLSMSSNKMQQSYASANILLSNLDPLFTEKTIARNLLYASAGIVDQLFQSGKEVESNRFNRLLMNKWKEFGISTMFLFPPSLMSFYCSLFFNQVRQHMRSISFGKLVKNFIKQLLIYVYYKPTSKFSSYSSKLHTAYTKWKFRKQLQDSMVHLSSSADLLLSETARFKARSLHIGDYSQFSMAGDKSVFWGGDNVSIHKYCHINIINGKLELGNHVLLNNYTSINCMDEVVIGHNTWFGEGVRVYDHNHKYEDKSSAIWQQGFNSAPIKIGNNCWIGANCVILKGVTIGDNTVIGANNLIYKSIPSGVVVKAAVQHEVLANKYLHE